MCRGRVRGISMSLIVRSIISISCIVRSGWVSFCCWVRVVSIIISLIVRSIIFISLILKCMICSIRVVIRRCLVLFVWIWGLRVICLISGCKVWGLKVIWGW